MRELASDMPVRMERPTLDALIDRLLARVLHGDISLESTA